MHTHSRNATQWAQAGKDIPCFGTTHADYFYGSIPCTRVMTDDEITGSYEFETGNVIVERFKDLDYSKIQAVLVNNHGPFTWGSKVYDSVENSVVLEEIALMAKNTLQLNPYTNTISKSILDKHYFRKHGDNAYYGQGVQK